MAKQFQPSPQQANVLDWIVNGSGSVFIEAVAGAGKTSTLVQALARTTGSVAFAAYNKKIAEEIKIKVANRANPQHEDFDPAFKGMGNRVSIGTFHSFGFAALRKAFPSTKVDASLKDRLTVEMFNANHIPQPAHTLALKLISLAKQGAVGLFGSVSDTSLWYSIIDHHDLAYDVEEPDTYIPVAIDAAIQGIKHHREIADKVVNFDDMIYLPVVSGMRLWQNDWVFVDEAQDTNPARRALARKMLKNNGRAVFVGDRHQAIYGFTGADSDAVDLIIRDFKCSQAPLTITFRCPKSVVRKAQEVVNHIEAHESAPEGTVSFRSYSELVSFKLSAKDAILCRNTKPLVQTAYSLIRQGVACHVEGRDIGTGLLKLVNRWAVRDVDDLQDKLEAYRDREIEKLMAKGRETQAEAIADRVDTIITLMEGCQTVDCVRRKIAEMFMDSETEAKPTLTLSTVHKAKGREWERVFILAPELMPSKWARQNWQQEQERNLMYVAYTRSMSELIFLSE